jgi:RHS repeat-associated protein
VIETQLVHMNGRIYDPTLGRFLQADPFIQAPKNSQSYNRYAYVALSTYRIKMIRTNFRKLMPDCGRN